jgi:hypothetical protein
MDLLKSLIRQATREKPLNIIVVGATHERYESNLCKTGHNFFCLKNGKEWDSSYAPVPENYHIINQIPYHQEFDLILVHTSDERINVAQDIQEYCNIPIIRHCHVLPDIRYNLDQQKYAFQSVKVDLTTFISEFNMNSWGYNKNNSRFINHGMDTDFWLDEQKERDNVLLSVVNYWSSRDWACGWELWKDVVSFNSSQQKPIRVAGKNPGLSEAATTLDELKDIYNKSSIFLNTSIHSPVPMSMMEAMACGCAIVSTATCMIPEIIQHGENGLISNNPNELKKYCQELLDNPSRARELGLNAQKTIKEKYNLNQFINKWNTVFEEVLYS